LCQIKNLADFPPDQKYSPDHFARSKIWRNRGETARYFTLPNTFSKKKQYFETGQTTIWHQIGGANTLLKEKMSLNRTCR
jgi:hypothetical protein